MNRMRIARVDASSVICGFACFLPIAGVRGAAFCLFPGIAQGSWQIAAKGAVLGFVADIGVTIAWWHIVGVWDPRKSFNYVLIQYLPPDFEIATHFGSPLPNSVKFGFGLVVWMSTMFAVWMALWKPSLQWVQRLTVFAVGSVLVGICAATLWGIAPVGEQQTSGHIGDSLGAFLALFLATMPACSLVVAILISVFSDGGIEIGADH